MLNLYKNVLHKYFIWWVNYGTVHVHCTCVSCNLLCTLVVFILFFSTLVG